MEHLFKINDLPEAEKVKVDMVSFGQDEVNRFKCSNNQKKVRVMSRFKGKDIPTL